MLEYQDVISRLRKGLSIRSISKELGIHRTTIRELKAAAELTGWLDSEAELPQEAAIRTMLHNNSTHSIEHPLDKWKDKLKEWADEDYSFVVIHQLISKYHDCSESTVRRYIRKHINQKPVKITMVRETIAGEVMEVDFGYFGITYDPVSRKNRKTYVFSARLCHSRKAYREKVFNQDQWAFFNGHVHAFEYFGGIPEKVRPDNLKAAVIKASFESPIINRAYRTLAEHYGFLISPCLPYKANHKGGVENDIKYIKRNFWPLYKEGQKELGRKIPWASDIDGGLMKWTKEVTDARIVKGTGRTPNDIFESEEKSALAALPPTRWDPVKWAEPKVQENWRIQFDNAFYSVPYKYVGQRVQVIANSTHVHIFHDLDEIAVHTRAQQPWNYVRNTHHAPPEPEKYMSLTRQRIAETGAAIGPAAEMVVNSIFAEKSVDGLRPARGIIQLQRTYGPIRLEAACRRAVLYETPTYSSVKSILKNELDKLPDDEPVDPTGQRHFIFERDPKYFDPENYELNKENHNG